jgi:hypothetical protein
MLSASDENPSYFFVDLISWVGSRAQARSAGQNQDKPIIKSGHDPVDHGLSLISGHQPVSRSETNLDGRSPGLSFQAED